MTTAYNARIYAKALLELVTPQQTGLLEDQLRLVLEKLELNKDVFRVIESKYVKREQKKNLLLALFERMEKDIPNGIMKYVKNLFMLLLDKQRLNADFVRRITSELGKLCNKMRNILMVNIITARPIGQAQVDAIGKKLATRYAMAGAKCSVVVDEKVVGGVKIEVEGQTIDYSLQGKLKELSRKFVTGR